MMSSNDMEVVKRFIQHPENFMGHSSTLNAMQIANNPFGDYAPQSTQIQGILKGMYDAFVSDLEKDNAEESDAQTSFEALMATKTQELGTLQATLENQQLQSATKTSQKAENNERLDDTKAQLVADENLFEDVKSGCQAKADEWSERSRLHTEELAGINEAIGILTDPDSEQVFRNSTATFLQLESIDHSGVHLDASAQVAHLAQRYHSFGLAQLAAEIKSGGHFDKVIASIDQMIADLRREEQDDIDHRDRCQGAEAKNTNDEQDLNYAIQKAGTAAGVLEGEGAKLQTQVDTLKGDIERTKQEIRDALDMRNEAVADFTRALKDDADAVALLERTILTLTRFYRTNGIAMAPALVSSASRISSAPQHNY